MSELLLHIEADNIRLAQTVVAATKVSADWLQAEKVSFAQPARVCYALITGGIEYEAETGTQSIRMPWKLLEDRRGDCKSFAVFIAAICSASGRNVALRFVRQNGDAHFSHVYAVVDGVPVDPLLSFGEECASDSSEDVAV